MNKRSFIITRFYRFEKYERKEVYECLLVSLTTQEKSKREMYKVLIVCQGGMSSSFVVRKTKVAFENHNEEIDIHAYAGLELVDHIDDVEIVLVAPNILYMMDEIERICKARNIRPITIPFEYYGQMDGEAIRNLIIESNKKNLEEK
jgi:PTS system cellobiose-specific IIB component